MNKIEKELLKPKIDVVFHALFREENKKITEALISDILKEKVKIKTTNKDRFLNIKDPKQKLGIIDLRTEPETGEQQHFIQGENVKQQHTQHNRQSKEQISVLLYDKKQSKGNKKSRNAVKPAYFLLFLHGLLIIENEFLSVFDNENKQNGKQESS